MNLPVRTCTYIFLYISIYVLTPLPASLPAYLPHLRLYLYLVSTEFKRLCALIFATLIQRMKRCYRLKTLAYAMANVHMNYILVVPPVRTFRGGTRHIVFTVAKHPHSLRFHLVRSKFYSDRFFPGTVAMGDLFSSVCFPDH